MEILIIIAIGWIGWKLIKKSPQHHATSLLTESLRMMEEKRAKIEAQGIPYIHHNLSEGVFQMVNFPYKTYEEWDAAYREAAIESNPGLKPSTSTDDGRMLSLMDFLDDEPCRRAYRHHLDPKALGKKFGENFDLLDVGFADGSTTRELVEELKAKGEV